MKDKGLRCVSVSKLVDLFQPLDCPQWNNCRRPITPDEVLRVAKDDFIDMPWRPKFRRIDHIRRIAYLAATGWNTPIEIDFGVPGYCEPHLTDGYHRLCAAAIRKDSKIEASVSGELSLINRFTMKGKL